MLDLEHVVPVARCVQHLHTHAHGAHTQIHVQRARLRGWHAGLLCRRESAAKPARVQSITHTHTHTPPVSHLRRCRVHSPCPVHYILVVVYPWLEPIKL